MPDQTAPAARRSRLTADDRRRQLVGIGLAKLVDTPISDLSVDEVAAEAGISRGLLFHYFPTKRDFYLACVAAAGRRILRNTDPDPSGDPERQVRETVRLFVAQIARRRRFYLSLVRGTGGGDVHVAEIVDTIRTGLTDRVVAALALSPAEAPVVRGWWAYVEDRAIAWSAPVPGGEADDPATTESLESLVDHGVAALHALLAVRPDPGSRS